MSNPSLCGRFCSALAAVGSLLCLPFMAHAQMPAANATAAPHPPTNNSPVAVVGGQAITQGDFQTALEKQAGRVVLNKLVYTALVRQAATKAGILPTDEQVAARIAELARRSPQTAADAQNPVRRRDFREDLRTDMALENLRMKNITASDTEINTFYTAQKAAFTLPTQVQTTMVVTRSNSDAAHAESLLRQGMTPDEIALQPRLKVAGINGFIVNIENLPPAVREHIGKTVLSTKPGQVKTLSAGAYSLTFMIKSAQDALTPPLAQIREQVARQVKLMKAVSSQQELARLYTDNPPKFNDPKYEAYFSDINTVSNAR